MRHNSSLERERKFLLFSLLQSIVFTLVFWLVYAINSEDTLGAFHRYGLIPHQHAEYWRWMTMHFMHSDLGHIWNNSLLLVPLVFGIRMQNRKIFFPLLGMIALGSAAFIYWMGSPQSIHGGASTLVYGFSFYLFSHGILSRRPEAIGMALTVILIASGLFWGLFPNSAKQVSSEGHVGGALAGASAAWVYFLLFKPLPSTFDKVHPESIHFFEDNPLT